MSVPRGPRYDLDVALQRFRLSVTELAIKTGINRRVMQRWATDGLSHAGADRIACQLGYMAFELWPAWATDKLPEDPVDDDADTESEVVLVEPQIAS